MPDLTAEFLMNMKELQNIHLHTGEGHFLPVYQGASLLNLPDTILQCLGLLHVGNGPLAPRWLNHAVFGKDIQRVILVVVDGLGLDLFRGYLDSGTIPAWNRLVEEGVLLPITSVSPSTTAAALTTILSGRSPAEHGIVGYEVWLKEYGVVANMISHSPMAFGNEIGGLRKAGFNPSTFLPVPVIGPYLRENGVRAGAFMYHAIARSGLSEMQLSDMDVFPYRGVADLWISLAEWVRQTNGMKSLAYVYWGDVDENSHRFGPQDERVRVEFERFSQVFEQQFLNRMDRRGDTLLLMTADHGLIPTPKNPTFDLKNHPGLLELLHLYPTGEHRMAYLFVRPGKTEAVRNYFEQAWPGDFVVLPADEIIKAGLLGPGTPATVVKDRVGDLVAFAQGNAYLWWAAKENIMLGRHGGLSPQEMQVPLLAVRL